MDCDWRPTLSESRKLNGGSLPFARRSRDTFIARPRHVGALAGALIAPGEISRFSGGISGQAQEWTTKIVQVDKLGTNSVLVEAELNIKLLNKSPESGTAVFRLVKMGNTWKLAGVEMFEVR